MTCYLTFCLERGSLHIKDWLTEEDKCTTTSKIINPIQENRQTEAVVASCPFFVKEEGTLAQFAGGYLSPQRRLI
ncbi:hypothetical protein CapIbe_012605 [Capra ibex]